MNESFIDKFQYSKFNPIKRKIAYLITNNLFSLFGKDRLCADAFYSTGVCYFGNEEWVLDLYDNIFSLAGYNYNLFIKHLDKIKRSLLRPNCLKIICRSESIRKDLIKYFGSKIKNKIQLEKPSLPTKEYEKIPNNQIKLLSFIGSINNKGDFYQKGGLYALEILEELNKNNNKFGLKFKMVLRCQVPEELKERVKKNKNIMQVDRFLTDEELEKLYKKTDMLLSLNQTFVLMTTLEAKSYSIPIMAFDTYSVKDYIKDKIEGYLIRSPINLRRFYIDKKYPTNIRDADFEKELKIIDKRVIRDACKIIRQNIK